MRSTKNCSDDIYKLSAALDKAEAVIIGAGAGGLFIFRQAFS